ncbi:hypothetical protein AB0E59_10005 [Lentzea sp. NPDC034063]|uniref:hypothetical protein n=1 Tax=unclassified Lentzea TaxID=2643253 RepID=UPI003408C211
MAFDLPPRRELPAEVKDRMRPAFEDSREEPERRGRAPLAVAAAVLLIAGGVAATQFVVQPFIHQARPGNERVVQPSGQDLARCRTALGDQDWQSAEMVEFGLRKVLIGLDGRFCELTRSQAFVAADGFRPAALQEGSVAYRSGRVIAGVPRSGARTVKARPKPGSSQSFEPEAGVVTPHFFVIETRHNVSALDLVFDDRAMPMPVIPENSATGSESYESGDANPWTPVNLIARCTDQAYAMGVSAAELQGWEPMLAAGLDQHDGMVVAHREHDVWAGCSFSGGSSGPTTWEQLRMITEKPEKPVLLGTHEAESTLMVVGRIKRSVNTVEVSDGDGSSVTADVVDGHFLAAVPVNRDDKTEYAQRLHVVGHDTDNAVVYEGGFE